MHQRPISVQAYDTGRYIPSGIINTILAHVLENDSHTVLEAAVGNGRFFAPLAERVSSSTELVGIDISQPMLAELTPKIEKYPNIKLYNMDLRDEAFTSYIHDVDTVFSFATLHILAEEWQTGLDNLVACLSSRGRIILGEEINAVFHGSENIYEGDDYRLTKVREQFSHQIGEQDLDHVAEFFKRYHHLRREHGHPFVRVNGQILHGDQSPAERYLRSKGFAQRTVSNATLSWLKPYSFAEIIYCMKEGTVTTFGTDLPDDVRQQIVGVLSSFCASKQYDIERKRDIPAQIQLHIFERHD